MQRSDDAHPVIEDGGCYRIDAFGVLLVAPHVSIAANLGQALADLFRPGLGVDRVAVEAPAQEPVDGPVGPVGEDHQSRGDNVHGQTGTGPIPDLYRVSAVGLAHILHLVP